MWSASRFFLGIAGLVLTGLTAPAATPLAVGDRVPDLTKFPLEGSLPDTVGKVVVLDFWASWCAPCKASFPAYDAMQVELRERGLIVLAVSVDQRVRDYERFVARLKPSFATVRDASEKLVAAVMVPAMPTSYIIDRHGVVRAIHAGYQGARTAEETRTLVTQLLEEKL